MLFSSIGLALVIVEISRHSKNMVSQRPWTPDHINEREYTVTVKVKKIE
jgi:hypothetical protein